MSGTGGGELGEEEVAATAVAVDDDADEDDDEDAAALIAAAAMDSHSGSSTAMGFSSNTWNPAELNATEGR